MSTKRTTKKKTTKKATPKKKGAKKPTTAKKGEREILYPKVSMRVFQGEKPLTAAQAKKLLGWRECQDSEQPLLRDKQSQKIICDNNPNNRSLTTSNLASLSQEILRGRWTLNGESRIIGETGLVLNGQHTLLALILSAQEWEKDSDKFPFWKTEPTIDTTLVLGVSENDNTINTLDTCKPRSLADVIYRSPFFSEKKTGERKQISRIAEYCVKTVWLRLGVKNAFGIRRTHSESIDFINRHPRILEAVDFVFSENAGKEKRLSRYVSPGAAAALLYLIGCSTSNARAYHQSENPSEEILSWDKWEQACDFFTLLAGQNEKMKPVSQALGKLVDDGDSSLPAKLAILIKAWDCFVAGGEITPASLRLSYVVSDDGTRTLVDSPTVGGIDVGDDSEPLEPDSEASEEKPEEPEPVDPTPVEIKTRKKAVRKQKEKAKEEPTTKKKTAKNKGFRVREIVWVLPELETQEAYQAKILKVLPNGVVVKKEQGFPGAGSTERVGQHRLSREQPDPT